MLASRIFARRAAASAARGPSKRLASAVAICRTDLLSSLPPALVAGTQSNQTRGSQGRLLFGCVAAVCASMMLSSDSRAENCGIVGVVAKSGSDEASNFLLEGLMILRNR